MLYRKADVLSIFNLFLLAVLIVFFLISIRSLITRGYNKKNVKSPVSFQAASPKYAKKDLMEYESILKNNPFGFKTDTLKPLGGSSGMPLPASDIKLIGTISGDDMFSYAVFAGSDGKQEIYRSGVFISGTGLLKKVGKNKVYIENGDLISEIPIVESLNMDLNIAPLNNEQFCDVNKSDKDIKSPVSSQAASPEYAKKGLKKYEPILKNNPFGVKADSLKPLSYSSGKPLSVPGMKLIGTISGDDMSGYAVFVGSNGKQEIYKAGEIIPGTGLLKKVDNNKVYIGNNQDAVSEIPVVQSSAIEKNKESLSNEPSSSAEQLDKGDYVIDQKIINEALDNPGQFLSQARLIPNMVDNHQDGFIVREVKSGGIHSLLGLKNDDILMRINDYDITNPEKALRAFSALKGANMVQLDIIRSGKRETMTYQIR